MSITYITYFLFMIEQEQLLPEDKVEDIEFKRKEVQPTNNDVVVEMNKPEQDPVEPITCPLCNRTFDSDIFLGNHAHSSHKELVGKVQALLNLTHDYRENDTAPSGKIDSTSLQGRNYFILIFIYLLL